MIDLEKLLKEIKAGKFDREMDESYAGGFWDLSYELEDRQWEIYDTLWEIVEHFMEEKK